jgi:hypothetical protein
MLVLSRSTLSGPLHISQHQLLCRAAVHNCKAVARPRRHWWPGRLPHLPLIRSPEPAADASGPPMRPHGCCRTSQVITGAERCRLAALATAAAAPEAHAAERHIVWRRGAERRCHHAVERGRWAARLAAMRWSAHAARGRAPTQHGAEPGAGRSRAQGGAAMRHARSHRERRGA